MHSGKVNNIRYDDPWNLMKQLVPKEKLGGDQSQGQKNPLLDRDLQ